MSQTTIPLEFEQYLLDKITAGTAPNLDEFVFAYIPNLDLEQPIDRATGLPDESFIVHRQNVDQTARLNRNTLIYSVIVQSNVAPFTFNTMYLHDKNVPESCGLIVHKTAETKESGMAIVKSVSQEYDGAAEIAGIHIDPATWQIDYHARLFGIDEELRLTQLDKYGHTAFISGFNVVKLTSNDYRVDPGIVYVGGMRCELKTALTRTVTAKPNGLYVDVVREGSTLSKWENVPTIKVSNTPLSDYVDEQGYQHYVARLAGVDASGNVQDWREWDIVSQTEAEEGTSAIRRFWSVLRITQLISAWWNRSAMKTKLDGIQEGAQANVATNLATTADATSRTVTSSTGANAIFPAATTTVAGVMTASDKAKLNGIQAGAQVNRPLGSGAGQVCEGNDSRLSNAREWIADIVPQAEAEAGTSSMARKWTAQRVRQVVNAHAALASRRVGETYVQFPGQATPASLFGGTWSALFDNEGVFFRTPGNGALAFNSGIQPDAMQEITGSVTGVQGWVSGSSLGALKRTQHHGQGTGGSASTTNNMSISFDSSLSPNARTSSETRPRNRTIRVWVKTA